eukprot:Seg827.5 transcript_id=Seg827.5/GoldUCD/mRNA.D3Y31 product="hypothetical protein" protein_id=Seg827.5/GoldUCD/D3Y31
MVDGTPDSSHTEQTTFILRYLKRDGDAFSVQERFMVFADCCNKTGVEIASVILETLQKYDIPIADCRGQGYDNAANMSGNPQRWKILQSNIGSSLHGLSGTRWKDRVASVHPFAAHLPGIKVALQQLLASNLTPKTTIDVNGAIRYVSSFVCIVMSAIWLKILVAIDQRNQVIQARKATINVEVTNLRSLVADLKEFREKWPQIVQESVLVATAMNISAEFPTKRKSKRQLLDDPEDSQSNSDENVFKREVFYVAVDSVIAGITTRYEAAYHINDLFSFLWQYLERTDEMIHEACVKFGTTYGEDISPVALEEEVLHIKTVNIANFGEKALDPHALLNQITKFKLEEIFYNVCTALRIFFTLPVTVASAERSFKKLKLIKNLMRSTMTQDRLTDFAMLSIESEIARTVDFNDIIHDFANMKVRKVSF